MPHSAPSDDWADRADFPSPAEVLGRRSPFVTEEEALRHGGLPAIAFLDDDPTPPPPQAAARGASKGKGKGRGRGSAPAETALSRPYTPPTDAKDVLPLRYLAVHLAVARGRIDVLRLLVEGLGFNPCITIPRMTVEARQGLLDEAGALALRDSYIASRRSAIGGLLVIKYGTIHCEDMLFVNPLTRYFRCTEAHRRDAAASPTEYTAAVNASIGPSTDEEVNRIVARAAAVLEDNPRTRSRIVAESADIAADDAEDRMTDHWVTRVIDVLCCPAACPVEYQGTMGTALHDASFWPAPMMTIKW